MRKVGFVVDSTFGDVIEDVSVVPLSVNIDGKNYIDGDFDYKLVVDALKNKKEIRTSQPSPDSFVEAYKKQLEKYDSVICLTLSSTLSGTVNSANLAISIGEFDNVKVIDTKTINIGAQYILEEAIKFAAQGKSKEEVIDYINLLINQGELIFTVDDLSTLVQNGRLSRVQSLIGNILKIKPILNFKQGVLEVENKVRGITRAFNYMANRVKEVVLGKEIEVRITYVDNYEYAEEIKTKIEELNLNNVNVEIRGVLSPVVSAHVGLGGSGIYLAYK